MVKHAVHPDIYTAKQQFNAFFREDLYGQFDDDANIILSRGAWQDDTVQLPMFFKYTLNYTMDKHWIGYSDSLGHERVYDSLKLRFNHGFAKPLYNEKSFALTLGNTTTMGFVYRELSRHVGNDATILMTKPFYPSIAKSLSNTFSTFAFVDGLQEEASLLQSLLDSLGQNQSIGVIHLSNFIGVEGRIFSQQFWKQLIPAAKKHGAYVVIDEGLWYKDLPYPPQIASDNVIRLVSPSKKYGIPGMKVGVMIASETFINSYYEQASTSYGGPASIFFLLLEFLFLFEYVYLSGDTPALRQVSLRYTDVPYPTVKQLYQDYVHCLDANMQHYTHNRELFEQWLQKHADHVAESYLFNGINFFIRLQTHHDTMYNFFKDLVATKGVSVMPSICFGDTNDQYIRISILENKADFARGLDTIGTFLQERQ